MKLYDAANRNYAKKQVSRIPSGSTALSRRSSRLRGGAGLSGSPSANNLPRDIWLFRGFLLILPPKTITPIVMRKNIFMIGALIMLMACVGQTNKGTSDADSTEVLEISDTINTAEAVTAFVEMIYKEWSVEDILNYDYLKQHITPNLLKYLADAYDYDCEGECLATWKFFYEGGGDVGELKSRQITARDGNHVLVENKYVNYEYDVLLKVIKDGDAFKIDSLGQEKSEYVNQSIIKQ